MDEICVRLELLLLLLIDCNLYVKIRIVSTQNFNNNRRKHQTSKFIISGYIDFIPLTHIVCVCVVFVSCQATTVKQSKYIQRGIPMLTNSSLKIFVYLSIFDEGTYTYLRSYLPKISHPWCSRLYTNNTIV